MNQVSKDRIRVLPALDPDKFPKKSALTPIGAFSFGITSICVIGALVVYPSPLSWALFALAAVSVLATVWAACFFALRDPDRLQTEDFRIQKDMVARLVVPEGYSDRQIPPSDARLVPGGLE